jgi:CRP/FNR family transcriptional regulator, cyclic AMP receptor protein
MASLTKIYQAGSVLFYENDRSREMYIIQRGSARVYRTEKGQKVEICIVRKGGILGEMSLLDGRARSATVEVLEEMETAVITTEEFERKVHLIPDWFLSVVRILCARLREVDRKLKASLDEEIAANVASLISMMMNKRKSPEADSPLEENALDLKAAKNETMEILSLTHDKVLSAFKELEACKLIAFANNQLKIKDKKDLVLYSKFKRGIEVDHDMDMGRPLSEEAVQVLKLLYQSTLGLKTEKNGNCELTLSTLGANADKLFSEGEFMKELSAMSVVDFDEKKLLEAQPKEMAKINVNRRKIASILAAAMFGGPTGV